MAKRAWKSLLKGEWPKRKRIVHRISWKTRCELLQRENYILKTHATPETLALLEELPPVTEGDWNFPPTGTTPQTVGPNGTAPGNYYKGVFSDIKDTEAGDGHSPAE